MVKSKKFLQETYKHKWNTKKIGTTNFSVNKHHRSLTGPAYTYYNNSWQINDQQLFLLKFFY